MASHHADKAVNGLGTAKGEGGVQDGVMGQTAGHGSDKPGGRLPAAIKTAAGAGPARPRPKQACRDFQMRIDRNGTWYYQGSPINRKELVCLFASVLKRQPDGSFWLETPVERGRIEVEDAPFVAVEMCWKDCDCGDGRPRQCLTFRTNLDEIVTANAEHPIRVHLCPKTREPRPYITIRPGLEAKINRAVFYELVALGQTEVVDGREMLGVWSEGVFFPIDEIRMLDAAAE
jgi:uncharacterized protein